MPDQEATAEFMQVEEPCPLCKVNMDIAKDRLMDAARLQIEIDNLTAGRFSPQMAMSTLAEAFKNDPSYAHSWHCNIACAASDSGASHEIANEAATRFMANAFGVVTSSDMLSKKDDSSAVVRVCHECSSPLTKCSIVNAKTGEDKGHVWKCSECGLSHVGYGEEGEYVAEDKNVQGEEHTNEPMADDGTDLRDFGDQ